MDLSEDFVLYQTVAGDTWDQLALDIYGNKYYAAKLLEANPQLSGYVVLDEGLIMRIPILETAVAASLPPWKR